MTKALVPFDGREPEPRRGLLARILGVVDVQNEMERLRGEHLLIKTAIELNADLARTRRKAQMYLEVTKAEDRAAAVVAKEVHRREILESIEVLFADDPVTAEVLKMRVRQIFQQPHNGHHKRRRC